MYFVHFLVLFVTKNIIVDVSQLRKVWPEMCKAASGSEGRRVLAIRPANWVTLPPAMEGDDEEI